MRAALQGLLAFGFAWFFIQSRMICALDVVMATDLTHDTLAQVRWSESMLPGRFHEEDSAQFPVLPGRREYRVGVPWKIGRIQLLPTLERARVEIGEVRLSAFGFPLRTWGGGRGFDGWAPIAEVENFQASPRELTLRAAGVHPVLVSPGFDIQGSVRNLQLALALAAGLLIISMERLVFARGATRVALRPPRDMFAVWLALSCIVGGILLFVGIHGGVDVLRDQFDARSPQRLYLTGMRDRLGRQASPHEGELRLELDPFTIWRNFPLQRELQFTVDADGFRGGWDQKSPLPTAFVTGNSSAFGMGLRSDGELFTSRLNSKGLPYQFVNAAVPGWSSGQELASMVHQLDRFHPAIYLSFSGAADFLGDTIPDRVPGGYGFNHVFFRLLEDGMVKAYGKGESPPSVAAAYDPERALEAERATLLSYVSTLDKMNAFARAREARFVAILQPILGSKIHKTPIEASRWAIDSEHESPRITERYEAFIRQVMDYCRRKGLECIDLAMAPEIIADSEDLFIDQGHLNARGHQMIADRIARELGDLPPRRPAREENKSWTDENAR